MQTWYQKQNNTDQISNNANTDNNKISAERTMACKEYNQLQGPINQPGNGKSKQ